MDRRRNNGPVTSYAPIFDDRDDASSATTAALANASRSGANKTFFLQSGIVRHASGSAYYERNATKLLVTVHGPRPITKTAYRGVATLTCSVSFAPFCRPHALSGGSSGGDDGTSLAQDLSRAIASSVMVAQYPKSEIAIVCQVLEWDEAVLAGAVIAASTAIVAANIQVCDLVSAATISHDECTCVVAYMPNRKEVTMVSMTGGAGGAPDQIDQVVNAAIKQAEEVAHAMQKVLLQ